MLSCVRCTACRHRDWILPGTRLRREWQRGVADGSCHYITRSRAARRGEAAIRRDKSASARPASGQPGLSIGQCLFETLLVRRRAGITELDQFVFAYQCRDGGETFWRRPRLDASAAPGGVNQADGDAELLMQFAPEEI